MSKPNTIERARELAEKIAVDSDVWVRKPVVDQDGNPYATLYESWSFIERPSGEVVAAFWQKDPWYGIAVQNAIVAAHNEAPALLRELADEVERLRCGAWGPKVPFDPSSIADMIAKIPHAEPDPKMKEFFDALGYPNPAGTCATETSMIASPAMIGLFKQKNAEIAYLNAALKEAVVTFDLHWHSEGVIYIRSERTVKGKCPNLAKFLREEDQRK